MGKFFCVSVNYCTFLPFSKCLSPLSRFQVVRSEYFFFFLSLVCSKNTKILLLSLECCVHRIYSFFSLGLAVFFRFRVFLELSFLAICSCFYNFFAIHILLLLLFFLVFFCTVFSLWIILQYRIVPYSVRNSFSFGVLSFGDIRYFFSDCCYVMITPFT